MILLLFINLLLRGWHNSNAEIQPAIDNDYLVKNGICGEFPNLPRARISNTVPSPVRFPWSVLVMRTSIKGRSPCGGTIITKK